MVVLETVALSAVAPRRNGGADDAETSRFRAPAGG